MRQILLAVALLLMLPLVLAPRASAGASAGEELPAIVPATRLAAAVDADPKSVQLIDTRSPVAFALGHLPGAVRVGWDQSLGDLSKALEAQGLRSDRATVVYGDASAGWGEEGRILWMLDRIGYRKLSYLDGGYTAFVAKRDAPAAAYAQVTPVRPKRDPVEQDDRLDAGLLKTLLGRVDLLDVRTPQEFAGAVLYGEARGGHVPGAKNLEFHWIFGDDGFILPAEALRARLAAAGLSGERPLVVYCTRGVRSGLVAYVLRNRAQLPATHNYVGSWTEWAARVP